MRAVLTVMITALLMMLVFFVVNYKYVSVWAFQPPSSSLNLYLLFLKPILLTLGTILGILFRTLSEALERQETDDVNLKSLISKGVQSRSFWLASFASPVVILSMYPSIESIDNYVLVTLIAYENGFFFRVVVENRKRNLEKQEKRE